MEPPKQPVSAHWSRTLLLFGLVLGVAWLAREVNHLRLEIPGEDRWVASDADSLYHMRRLERVAEEGLPVAGRDPFLAYPEGAIIPWPPYYTLMLWTILGPGLPEPGAARQAYIEEWVATLPCVFGVITSLLAAWAGLRLGGLPVGLFAGLAHALSLASIRYSRIGNGDHHAWISMGNAVLLVLFTAAFLRGAFDDRRKGLLYGAAAGACVGIMLGSWVAALLYLVPMQLLLGWLALGDARRERVGLAPFGLALHLTALAVIAPAVAASPWKAELPWTVVNLSWFHVLFLTLGALVFVPLFFIKGGSAARRRYPWVAAATLLALCLLLAFVDAGPGRGIREGFAWVSRADDFMATISESRPLLGAGAPRELFELLGAFVVLLPFAWLACVWQAFRGGEERLLPWAIALPPLAFQAAGQLRFADALAMPMVVVLGWALGRLALSGQSSWLAGRFRVLRGAPAWALAGAGVGLALAAQFYVVMGTVRRLAAPDDASVYGNVQVRSFAAREMTEWLRRNTPDSGGYSVLANWSWGHLLEWSAGRPTVATNFGSYLGVERFRDPLLFLLAEDPREAEAILERRRARYVVVDSRWPNVSYSLARTQAPDRWARLFREGPAGERSRLRPGFFRTMGARLSFGGNRRRPDGRTVGPTLDFLRLLHVSPITDLEVELPGSEKQPCGWIYERVPGAVVTASAPPGTTVRIEVDLVFPPAYPVRFRAEAVTDELGVARLRVPYSTAGRNGDGRVAGNAPAARWSVGDASGVLTISEADVLHGNSLSIP